MSTIVYVVLTVVWIIADILNCRSNKRLSKQLEEAKKALDDNTSLTKEYQSVIAQKTRKSRYYSNTTLQAQCLNSGRL